MYVLETEAGLCNRLRVLFSYALHARSLQTRMLVYWTPDSACNGFFLDYFEPLPHVLFKKDKPRDVQPHYRGFWWHPDYDPYKMFIYHGLQLNPSMKQKLRDLINRMGDPSQMIAVHVRRTDHTEDAKHHKLYTTDAMFFQFIDQHPDKNVYLATDNITTQTKYLEKYGADRIRFQSPISPSVQQRHTTLEDAILDLFFCTLVHDFKGSGWSSFSDTIMQLRQQR